MKKRLIAAIVAVAIVLGGLGTFIVIRVVKNRKPPELSEILPRIEELLKSSREVNQILFGEGLPTYPRIYREYYERHPYYLEKKGDAYVPAAGETPTRLYFYTFEDKEVGTIVAYQYCVRVKEADDTVTYTDAEFGTALVASHVGKYRYVKKTKEAGENPLFHPEGSEYYYFKLPDYEEKEEEFYYSPDDEPCYDYVRNDCGYLTVDSIKEKAEQVYSSSYLDSIYESLFTGITVSHHSNGTLYARYIDYTDSEGKVSLLKSNTQKGFNVNRVFLYDTIKMVRPSNSKFVTITVDSYLEGKPNEIVNIKLGLALQDSQWFLDSPTY